MRPHPIRETLKKLRPFIGNKADAFWIRYQTGDRDDRQEWEQTINLLAQRYGVDPVEEAIVLPPPSPDLSTGDISLGKVSYLDSPGYDFGLQLHEITRHIGIFGSTGTGKTTLAKQLLRGLAAKDIPFIIFDWERNYRDIAAEFPDIKLYTIGAKVSPFHFNFLETPPGLSADEYVKCVVDGFNRAYIGGVGSDSVLLKVFDRAYLEHETPMVKEAMEILAADMKGKLKGREMLWKQSSLRMFEFLLHGGTGDLLNVRNNPPPEKLFSECIIFELGALASPYDKRFFVEMFTLWLWLYREYVGIEDEHLKQVLLFEEFHNMSQQAEKNDFIQKLFRQIRKYGVGLVILDQTPSLIVNPIFENLYTKITFALSHGRNIQAIGDAMFMEREQRNDIGMLKTGQAICRLMGRHGRPFLLTVPYTKQSVSLSDEELKKRMAGFSEYSRPDESSPAKSSGIRSFQKPETLPPLAKILLEDLGKFPFLAVSHRYKKLGLGAAQGTDTQKVLIAAGLVSAVTLDGKRFLEPTDSGKKLLQRFGVGYSLGAGRGGFEHGYFVERIRSHMADSGGFVFIEQNDIDLVGYKLQLDGEYTVAVQVETGKSDLKKNVETLLSLEASARYMVATNKEAEIKLNNIHSKLDPDQQARIKILPAKAFLKESIFPS